MPKRLFIIHGWEQSPDSNWLPWLKTKLEAEGFDVKVPAMPDSDHPRMGAWVDCLAAAVGTPDEDCCFVGHSLGCITILRYLEGLKEGEVGGAVLVSGFPESLGIGEIDNFFETPVNWAAVSLRCRRFIAITSDNDPYVPLRQGEILRDMLGARLVVKHQGHFSNGLAELPDAYDAVLSVSVST